MPDNSNPTEAQKATQFGGRLGNRRAPGGKPQKASILRHLYRRMQAEDPLAEKAQIGGDVVARRLIEVALEGAGRYESASFHALKEIVDRVDGTVKQTIESQQRIIWEGVTLRDRRQTPEDQDAELAASEEALEVLDNAEPESEDSTNGTHDATP